MNSSKNIYGILGGVLLILGLLVLLSAPALGQDSQQEEESLSWYQKLTSPEGLQEQFDSSPILFFAAVFALGVAVSLTPCVLPMIPITISIISGSKQAIPGRSAARSAVTGLANSLVYVLGLSITYAVLGLLAATFGVVVRVLLQSCPVQIVIGAIFLILGLSMTGAFPLPLPGWGSRKVDAAVQRQKSKKSLLSVFILGLFSGIVASPCVAPVIGALLVWVSSAGIWLGFWALFIFGWGMGLLLIVLGMTGWIISSGKWMVTVKAILGVVLILVGLWFAVQGIQCLSPIPVAVMGDREPIQSQEETATALVKPAKIEWLHSEPEGLARAKGTYKPFLKKPLMIDFRADWCVYCIQMERTTLRDKRVIEALSRFITVKVDVTSRTPEGMAAAKKYRISGIPAFIFIDSNGKQTTEVGYIPSDRFLRILKGIK